MREIKFRGKSPEEEWVYGSYISRKQKHYLYDLMFDNKNRKKAVMRKSIGQYTGLKDKNGKEIYEGDILAAPHTYNIEIIYKNGGFLMKFFDDIGEKCEYHLSKVLIEQDDLEVVGNKYDNPELEEMIGG
jgi:uncharacterized phage protein (TIGR01671 family)